MLCEEVSGQALKREAGIASHEYETVVGLAACT
jgi:hypothetical protein